MQTIEFPLSKASERAQDLSELLPLRNTIVVLWKVQYFFDSEKFHMKLIVAGS
jgi:hypothetical protein